MIPHQISHKDIVDGTEYWYVLLSGGHCQLLKLRANLEDNKLNFYVVNVGQMDIKISLEIEDEMYNNLFTEEQFYQAEMYWGYLFIKNFESNNMVSFGRFLEIKNELYEKFPDMLLRIL